MSYTITRFKGALTVLADTLFATCLLLKELVRPPTRLLDREGDRRMLLLVTSFPPDISGGVYRPASFARYAPDSDWEVTVITLPTPENETQAGSTMRDYAGKLVRVLFTPRHPLRPSYKLFPSVDGGMMEALDMVRSVRNAFGADIPKTIVASGPSFSTFIAAWFLARSSRIRLVLEYRDEWSQCPFDFVQKSERDLQWELRCLGRADLIVLMTHSHKNQLEHAFPQLPLGKCEVIENGWEPVLQPQEEGAAPVQTRDLDLFHLTFAGMLGGSADPRGFLSCLARVLVRRPDLHSKVRVRFVGKKSAEALIALSGFPFPDVILSLDLVPLTEAKRLMRDSAAVLLLHSSSFGRYIPGKFYEYAASGATILLVDDIGECSQLIERLGFGRNLDSRDDHALELMLDELSAGQRIGRNLNANPTVEQQEWLLVHTRESLARRFFGLLDRLTTK